MVTSREVKNVGKLRIHPWLPETTSWGEKLGCRNCKKFGQPDESKPDSKCGRIGYVCGNWVEAEQAQITMNLTALTVVQI